MGYNINLFETMNNYYKKKYSYMSDVVLYGTIQPITTFSETSLLEMPFKISGRLITAGVYPDNDYGTITISPEELQRSVQKWNGIVGFDSHLRFQNITSGKDESVLGAVAKITKVFWNAADKAVDFFAEVYNHDLAMNILHGIVKYVSVGFARDIIPLETHNKTENIVKNIDPKEWSFVYNPRDKKAEIRPVL